MIERLREGQYYELCKTAFESAMYMLTTSEMNKRENYEDFKTKRAFDKMISDCIPSECVTDFPYEEYIDEYTTYTYSLGWDWIFGEKLFYKIMDGEQLVDEDFKEGAEYLIKQQ